MEFTKAQLENAFAWQCHRRGNYPDHADVWHLGFQWERDKVYLLDQLFHCR